MAVDDLNAFLRERIAEDEQAAQKATEGPWIAEVSGETGHCVIPADAESTREYVARTQLLTALSDADHIARHDPDRVLAEVQAKRTILAEYEKASSVAGPPGQMHNPVVSGIASGLDTAVRCLAAAYRHPDYRPEWAPEGA